MTSEIETWQEQGDELMIMMDANKDIWSGNLWKALAEKSIVEEITNKYGEPVPPIYDKWKNPIGGIFLSMTLQIVRGSYTLQK